MRAMLVHEDQGLAVMGANGLDRLVSQRPELFTMVPKKGIALFRSAARRSILGSILKKASQNKTVDSKTAAMLSVIG